MKKLLLFLLIATSIPTQTHAITRPQKALAYLKISYGLAALLMGAFCPFMGQLDLDIGDIFSESIPFSTIFSILSTRKEDDKLKRTMPDSGIFKSFRNSISHLSAEREKIKQSQYNVEDIANIQKTSGRIHFANSFFLLPFGIITIKKGYDELHNNGTKPALEETTEQIST